MLKAAMSIIYIRVSSYWVNNIINTDLSNRVKYGEKIKSQKLNSEENSKRKVPNQMAKSNNKTHQTNGQQLSYSWLGTGIFKYRKW